MRLIRNSRADPRSTPRADLPPGPLPCPVPEVTRLASHGNPNLELGGEISAVLGRIGHRCNPFTLPGFALLTALATLALVGAGGLVTSHGAGMAVPDWPNTYGYNMFFFPVSKWVGGIFYEHTHRLLASGVGLMTAILALWLHGKHARPLLRWAGLVLLAGGAIVCLAVPRHQADGLVSSLTGLAGFGASLVWPRCEPSPRWLRRLGLAAFLAVVLQGVLGGLRVVLFKDQIGIFHAALAQLFFVLTCAIALFTSNPAFSKFHKFGWVSESGVRSADFAGLRRVSQLFLAATVLIFLQLLVGATMRHQHAGLSIPDFPLAYGKLWPATDPAAIAHYNQQRMEVTAANPITAFQVGLQMVHRLLALLIVAAIGLCAWSARRRFGRTHRLTRLALVWFGLIGVQVVLGAATIWSQKAADIATLHVVTGAVSLALGAILSIISRPMWMFVPSLAAAPRASARADAGSAPVSEVPSPAPFGPRPAPAGLE